MACTKYMIIFLLLLLMCCGCGRSSEEKEMLLERLDSEGKILITVVPTTKEEVDITENHSTDKEIQFIEEQRMRELIIEELSATPTPGPEPYSLLQTDRNVEQGDVVLFGAYTHRKSYYLWQEGYGYGEEFSMPIKWLVLDKIEDKILVLSLYNIDVKSYVDIELLEQYTSGVTWESSTLRVWLNENFYVKAFSEEEKQCIIESKVSSKRSNSSYENNEKMVSDQIFLLSCEEAERYFVTEKERRTQTKPDVEVPIDYMPVAYVHRADSTDYYGWWLRSEGETAGTVMYVNGMGEIIYEGIHMCDDEVSVRPAMWIDLEKVKEIGLELEAE